MSSGVPFLSPIAESLAKLCLPEAVGDRSLGESALPAYRAAPPTPAAPSVTPKSNPPIAAADLPKHLNRLQAAGYSVRHEYVGPLKSEHHVIAFKNGRAEHFADTDRVGGRSSGAYRHREFSASSPEHARLRALREDMGEDMSEGTSEGLGPAQLSARAWDASIRACDIERDHRDHGHYSMQTVGNLNAFAFRAHRRAAKANPSTDHLEQAEAHRRRALEFGASSDLLGESVQEGLLGGLFGAKKPAPAPKPRPYVPGDKLEWSTPAPTKIEPTKGWVDLHHGPKSCEGYKSAHHPLWVESIIKGQVGKSHPDHPNIRYYNAGPNNHIAVLHGHDYMQRPMLHKYCIIPKKKVAEALFAGPEHRTELSRAAVLSRSALALTHLLRDPAAPRFIDPVKQRQLRAQLNQKAANLHKYAAREFRQGTPPYAWHANLQNEHQHFGSGATSARWSLPPADEQPFRPYAPKQLPMTAKQKADLMRAVLAGRERIGQLTLQHEEALAEAVHQHHARQA